MNKRFLLKAIHVFLVFVLTFSLLSLNMSAHALTSQENLLVKTNAGEKISPQLQNVLQSSDGNAFFSVIVTLNQQADLSRVRGADRAARQQGVILALQATANATQGRLTGLLNFYRNEGKVSSFSSFWIFNGFSVTATSEVIDALLHDPAVLAITPDDIQIVTVAGQPEPNISLVNAPALWSQGYYGQGVVVASMDSGVNVTHPDLSSRWRGGSNSWFDPYGQHSTPVDLSGHGTWTTGVMVGGDAGGTSIGVAPNAQWIAVKIFNDQGNSTATAIHQGFQWLLDPDGNPDTDDAPHVVNNSWTYANPGCYLDFEPDLQSLRAAGILPVFAAGNGGPYSNTSYSPANNPSAFAVGALDNNNLIYSSSSLGPTTCGGSAGPFPEIVAPGVNIHTTDLYSFYYDATGTSLAAPHVAGGLALLLNAFPDLSSGEQESALTNSAVDLGIAGPDDVFGFGRLDLLAAYQWVLNNPTPDPTNLALGQSVTVSSFQDNSHDGSKAVDGDNATYWQSKQVKGNRGGSSSEWLVVDLGGNASINEIVLEWDAYYATDYVIQVSSDASAWTTVFSTSSGNGGNDTISLSVSSARYVRMESTAWNDAKLRNWLKEFGVYGNTSSTPTQTPPPSGGTVHVGDLDGSSTLGNRNRWDAFVVITVHDDNENPVGGATVAGSWSPGGSGTCLTNSQGQCILSRNDLKGNQQIVTFTVDDISFSMYGYQSGDSHDPDGDSNGIAIFVAQP